jgi:hypothetical protein
MKKSPRLHFWAKAAAALVCAAGFGAGQARVIDDFNAAQRSGWEDANPANLPLPGGQQANGVFTFSLPALGQPYFVSSTKKSETLELKEGRTITLRVDLVNGQGPDSFAVLAWIPQATGPNTLAGYGLAKSTSDILITKGINKYFLNQATALKNENITLVLQLKVKGGSVYITGQVLDKDDNNAVIYERSYVDTPGADVLDDGTDSPPAPFLGLGHPTLYLYADGGQDPAGYQVIYDNLEVFVCDEQVLDDFNAAQRSGWEDANPANLPLPGGQQANGVFTFGLPALGQPYFISSTKKSKTFTLEEGTTHEFSVDLVSGQGPDSFAVLAWIPQATGANTLAGYGLAKSTSDILITKGINKYFFNQALALKNDNVTLSLALTVRNGEVIIRGRVYDRDDNNAIIFDRTYVDTAGADVLDDGTDSPPAPFVGPGHVVLYLYADGGQDPAGYQVIYDNLIACAPPEAANQPPILSEINPRDGANFLPASTQITFRATDDKPLADSAIRVILNGVAYTTANGLVLGGSGADRTASLGGLTADQNYIARLEVTDADGVTTAQTIYFDTFTAAARVVEVEDYNFEGGSYFNNPVRTPEGWGQANNSYTDRAGVEGVDFHDTRTTPNGANTMYRTMDPVRMQRTLDLARPAFDPNNSIYDYDVGDLAADEWQNFTRDFTAGSYEVYLREAVVNFAQAESVLEEVTSDPAQPDQATRVLGSFLGRTSGFTFRNVPLTDGTGQNKIVLRLSGRKTLRLRHVTPDDNTGNRYLNYLVFLPVSDVGPQRPTIANLNPAPDAVIETIAPVITASIQNRDTSVNTATIQLELNGAVVPATVTPTATGAEVRYRISPLPPPGQTHTARLSFKDSEGVDIAQSWSFTLNYLALDPANRRSGPGLARGFNVRMVQAPALSNLENSLDRAENQLAPNSTIPKAVETNVVEQLVNMAQDDRPSGYFTADNGYPESLVPGLAESQEGTEDFAVEITAWLELAAGAYRFGVVTDDGYKISSGARLSDKTPVLGFHNGGPANETFEFVVTQAGFYPFRMVWYERGGNAYAEWFSVDLDTGERTLINDAAASKAVKAYVDVAAEPEIKLQSTARLGEPFADDESAVINTGAKTITVPVSGPTRFYRLRGGQAYRIKTIQLQGANLMLSYE